MDQSTIYAAGFANLAMELHEADDLDETVTHVLSFARQALPCDFTGLMLRTRGDTFRTAGGCDPRVAAADRFQTVSSEGPWLSRGSEQLTMIVLDTADDARWPRWGPRAARLGLRSLLSIRLLARRSDLGLLTFYSLTPGRFAEADSAVALLLASHAAIAIDAAREAETLNLAIEARSVIGKAQGLLMERYRLNADQAFAVLQRYSQHSNTKLHDVAAQLLKTRELPVPRETEASSGRA